MNVDCYRYCLQKGECVVKVKYCYLYCHNSRSLFHLMFAHLQQAQTADAFWQVRILRTYQNYDLFILNTEFFVPGLFRYMTDCSAWCVETKMPPSGTLVLVFNLNVIWNQVGSFVVSVWTPFGFGIRHRIETYSKYFSRLHVPFHNPYSRPRVTLWRWKSPAGIWPADPLTNALRTTYISWPSIMALHGRVLRPCWPVGTAICKNWVQYLQLCKYCEYMIILVA